MNKEELDKKILHLNARVQILEREVEWQDILNTYSYRYGRSSGNNEITAAIYEKGVGLREKLKIHQTELEKFKLEYKTRFIDPILKEMREKYNYEILFKIS